MNREEAINYLLEKEFIVEKKKECCDFCGGRGWIVHDNFHMGRTSNQTCPQCKGRGYKERIKYRIPEQSEDYADDDKIEVDYQLRRNY